MCEVGVTHQRSWQAESIATFLVRSRLELLSVIYRSASHLGVASLRSNLSNLAPVDVDSMGQHHSKHGGGGDQGSKATTSYKPLLRVQSPVPDDIDIAQAVEPQPVS